MKKKLFIFLFVSIIALPLLSQSLPTSYYTLLLRGGYGKSDYGLENGTIKGSIAYGAEFEYAFFFHKNVGIGIGTDFQCIGSTGILNTSLFWNDVIDTDGERYNHQLNLYDWRERQTAFYLEFPVTLQTQFRFSPSCGLLLKAGAAYALMLTQKTSAYGTIEHLGNYDRWYLMLDIPEYGFYIEKDFKPKYNFNNVHSYTLIFSADMCFATRSNIEFLCGLYAGLNIRNLKTQHSPLGFRNDREGSAVFHYFMNDYSTILNTDYVKNTMYSYSIQLQLGIRFSQNHYRKHKCNCYKY